MKRASLALCFAICATALRADIITVMVGDNDGFGYGAAVVPDNSPLPDLTIPTDNRSAAEAAATNGAQQTDLYSALNTPVPTSFQVLFPYVGTLLSGSFTVDMGGFQASTFGQLTVDVNGVAAPNLFNFDDGAFATAVRTFTLTAPEIAAANIAGEVVLDISRGSSSDGVSFDYFELDGTTSATTVPEPSSIFLLGTMAAAVAGIIRRRRAA